MTGAGTSVSHGYPDFGLLTMSEMVDNAARIVRAVDVPVIARIAAASARIVTGLAALGGG